MRSRFQSVGKEAPVYVDNEDAGRADDGAGVWAVADGAGGTGIYVGEWANHLVQQVPAEPFGGLARLTHWLDGHWTAFFDTYRPQAETDYLINHKFMREGSGATLATLHHRADRMHWFVYGDAVALWFQPATGELGGASLDVGQFTSAPHLLNWLDPPRPDGLRSGVWPHQSGRQYALLSDALGQYVLMAYAARHGDRKSLRALTKQPTALGSRAQAHVNYGLNETDGFGKSVWEPLRTALRSADAFLTYTRLLRNRNLLGADDYTCILIED